MSGSQLATAVSDPDWARWIASIPPTGIYDPRDIDRLADDLAAHLHSTPSLDQLSPLEARRLAEDLMLLLQEVQSLQDIDADGTLLDWLLALTGLAGAILLPDAAVLLATPSVVAAGWSTARNRRAKRRSKLIQSLSNAILDLSRRLRR